MKAALLASTAPFSGVSDQPQQQQRPPQRRPQRDRAHRPDRNKSEHPRGSATAMMVATAMMGVNSHHRLAPEPPSAARFYLTAKQLRARYGGRSHMWIERRLLSDPTFPRPAYFGRFRFWALDEIEAWERAAIAARDNNSSEAA